MYTFDFGVFYIIHTHIGFKQDAKAKAEAKWKQLFFIDLKQNRLLLHHCFRNFFETHESYNIHDSHQGDNGHNIFNGKKGHEWS